MSFVHSTLVASEDVMPAPNLTAEWEQTGAPGRACCHPLIAQVSTYRRSPWTSLNPDRCQALLGGPAGFWVTWGGVGFNTWRPEWNFGHSGERLP